MTTLHEWRHRERRLRSDQTYDVVLEAIVVGAFAPGSKIAIDELAHDLQVSRTPLREALTRLSWVGMVSVARNARTKVADWSSKELADRVDRANAASTALSRPATTFSERMNLLVTSKALS